ncbi:MAG: hypothetical protein DCC54_12740 [Anaerolineae bacterium]|nr:MAG: hypothetical protein DCC54_12740 [Anaerolineae bacterium]
MDEVGLDALDHTAEVHDQFGQVAPAEFVPPTRPLNLFNLRRDGAILHLSRSALEADKEDLIPGFG